MLILDEPTAQLDVRAEAAFYDRFLEITQGVTSIVISHRFSTVRRANRIAVLDGGQITELGSHTELLALKGPTRTFSPRRQRRSRAGGRRHERYDSDRGRWRDLDPATDTADKNSSRSFEPPAAACAAACSASWSAPDSAPRPA